MCCFPKCCVQNVKQSIPTENNEIKGRSDVTGNDSLWSNLEENDRMIPTTTCNSTSPQLSPSLSSHPTTMASSYSLESLTLSLHWYPVVKVYTR